MKQPVRAYAVDATIDGQRTVLVQIEIDCAECGTVQLLIPGHHLRTVRDICIDQLDHFPEFATGTLTKTDTTGPIRMDSDRSKKPELN